MDVPSSAKINNHLHGADFYDCHVRQIAHQGQSALDVYLQMMHGMPKWIDTMMVLRNKAVSKLGLKDLGKISHQQNVKPADEYEVGEVLGIFSIYQIAHNEIILEDKDRHLNVKISFYVEPTDTVDRANISITTVVHNKNIFGKIYMFFVKPMHKLIVPATLKTLVS